MKKSKQKTTGQKKLKKRGHGWTNASVVRVLFFFVLVFRALFLSPWAIEVNPILYDWVSYVHLRELGRRDARFEYSHVIRLGCWIDCRMDRTKKKQKKKFYFRQKGHSLLIFCVYLFDSMVFLRVLLGLFFFKALMTDWLNKKPNQPSKP